MAKRTTFSAREASERPAERSADKPAGEIADEAVGNTADDTAGKQPVSRRDFFFRAGQLGYALSVLGPGLHEGLGIFDAHAPPAAGRALDGRALPSVAAPEITNLYSGLRWRHIGPFRGGRTDAVSGVPGRPNEFYYGAVNGGVWKTHDAGRTWQPVFDSQPVASIGALAVAPSAPDVVYVGSGESTLRDSVGYGNGVYKSTDAGATWTHLGLDDTQHIARVAVSPRDPNVVFVAAIGHYYGPNAERGVFRSTDGGRNWRKVLFVNENVGASEVVIDPTDPRVVYAALWNTRRPPWFVYAPTNGPGGGIYKSTDGGDSWKQLTRGLPAKGIGKCGIAVCPTNPKRVYAVIDDLLPDPAVPVDTSAAAVAARQFGGGIAGLGGFFRSDDAGETWTRLSSDPAVYGRGWYFGNVAVDPTDADVVYVPNVSLSRSMDGGHTWVPMRGSPGGDDYQQALVSPNDPNTLIVACDQGTIITRNAREPDPTKITWSSWLNQSTAQIYHVSVDYRFPYWVTGAQQDSGAVAVASRGKYAEIATRDWEPIGAGGESGYTAGDPLHPGIVYGGTGSRFDLENALPVPGTTSPEVDPPDKARTDWTQPLVLSRADPRALYYANQFLFKSTDSAKTWTRISPDLTRPAPGVPPLLDAAAAADTGENGQRGVIYTIAPSPLLVPMVWIGTDDGFIQLTTTDGRKWENVTPSALTAWSRVTMMEASHFDFNTAYAAVDRHQLEDFAPYIYRTRDMGKSWQRITTGLPAEGYVHTVKEDPERQGLLYAGTERGVFVSFDDGDNWHSLRLNLPVTSMRDMEVYNNDLILATHGRGFWVMDDINVLRRVDPKLLASEAVLFKPNDAIFYAGGSDNGTPLQKDEPQAENAPNGAAIDYYLGSRPNGPVTLEILDVKGEVVHTFTDAPSVAQQADGGRDDGQRGDGKIPNTSALWRPEPVPFAVDPGMHRVVWLPVKEAPRGSGGFRRRRTPLLGTFTARLTVNGKSSSESFTVKPDPRVSEMTADDEEGDDDKY